MIKARTDFGASRRHGSRRIGIDCKGIVNIRFRLIDGGVGCGIDDHSRSVLSDRIRTGKRIAQINIGARKRNHIGACLQFCGHLP